VSSATTQSIVDGFWGSDVAHELAPFRGHAMIERLPAPRIGDCIAGLNNLPATTPSQHPATYPRRSL